MGTGDLYREQSGQEVKLTTHLYLVLRLRIHGATPRLPQYVFVARYLDKHHSRSATCPSWSRLPFRRYGLRVSMEFTMHSFNFGSCLLHTLM
jgi:hypothetical protein